jgi:hypothetical protein
MKEAVQALVDQFKTGINNLVLQQINESLGDLGAPKGASTKQTRTRAPRAANGNGHKAAPVAQRSRRAYGEKRSAEEIEATGAKFLEFVTEHHGQNIEAISAAINIPTSELQTPVKKLIAAGEVKVFGERRATRYFPKSVRPTKAMVEAIKAGGDGASTDAE